MYGSLDTQSYFKYYPPVDKDFSPIRFEID